MQNIIAVIAIYGFVLRISSVPDTAWITQNEGEGPHRRYSGSSGMQLKALRYFLMVSSTGSFLATARHFGVPASSVSRYIAALEKELNQQLLYRSTRAVTLTEEGSRFYSQIREAIELIDDAADQILLRDENISGKVRINAPEALGRLHIARLVSTLQARYPKVSVELTLTDAFIDPVYEGADITFRVSPLIDSGMTGRVICGQSYLIAASPEYLRINETPQKPSDLLHHSCLLYKGISGSQKWYFRQSSRDDYVSVNVSGGISSNNAEVLVSAALAGRGIVLFPTWLFSAEQFVSGQLVRLLPDWDVSAAVPPTYIHVLMPENKLRSNRIRKVLNFFIEEIGSPPCWDAGII